MYKESFIINFNTLLHVSTLLGRLQGELVVIVTLRLREIPVVPACKPGPQFTRPKTTQYTVNSTLSLKYKVQP
jgi:hypothetical protein